MRRHPDRSLLDSSEADPIHAEVGAMFLALEGCLDRRDFRAAALRVIAPDDRERKAARVRRCYATNAAYRERKKLLERQRKSFLSATDPTWQQRENARKRASRARRAAR